MQSRNRGSFFATLWDFSYEPSNPADWIKFGCQVGTVGFFILLIKAMDGTTCGQGWSFWVPQTWGNPAGCTLRGLVRNVPDTFLNDRNTSSPGIVEPARNSTLGE